MLSWRLIRRFATLSCTFGLVMSGFALSGASDQRPVAMAVAAPPRSSQQVAPAAEPPVARLDTAVKPKPVVVVEQSSVPKPKTTARVSDLVAELAETPTKPFSMVGVTWSSDSADEGVKVHVRTRTSGKWSKWQELDVENDSDPSGRHGTDPLWVADSDGVAARVTGPGSKPRDVKVTTIDPGETDTSATAEPAYYSTAQGTTDATTVADVGDGTPSFTPRPSIVMRGAWGAAPSTPCDSPRVGSTTKGVIVHHTAGANDYAKSQSAAIVRATQAYHMKGRGWCDIGYNFLVDKYGQIFEGRAGGIDRTVRAAHSGNLAVNTYTMGVSMMGHLDKVRPTTAMKASMVKLIGWRMGTTYMQAKGTYGIDGLTLNRIAGHRNVISTGCPGKYGYEWLNQSGGLRDRVEAYMSKFVSDIKTRAKSLGAATTGPVFIGEAGTNGGRKTRFGKLDMYFKSGAGTRTVTASGGFRTKYAALKSQLSPLGFPTSDSPVVGSTGTFVQRFQQGSIFAIRTSSATTLHALWGPIAQKYKELGEALGKLGAPTSSVVLVSGGSRANFAKGYILYSNSTQKAVAYDSSGKAISTTTTTAPSPDVLTVPSSRAFTLRGHGFGHGIGMSQYGAQGAAIGGKKFAEILAFYYPGTALGSKTGKVRVLISKDTTVSVIVAARSGLTFRKLADNTSKSLPMTVSGKTVQQWRIVPLSSDKRRSTLQFKSDGSWFTYANTVWTGDAQFEASYLRLYLPDGSGVTYRGFLRSAVPAVGSTDRNTVNVVPLESYLRGVVAAEMPSSWKPEALKAQSVAARSYAVRGLAPSRYYDLCDTTSCQVYRGVSAERATTDAAIVATAGKILTYQSKAAFTQFSSSSGGATAIGSQPYLIAKADNTYDVASGNPNRNWSTTVNASTLEKAYPAMGTLKSLKVTKREGVGDWGGRVTTVSLIGSKSTVTISGPTMRSKFGLRSAWFRFN